MGSSMKPTIFNEQVAAALKKWHQTAKKQIKQSKIINSTSTPMSTSTPISRGMSPVHLLNGHHYKSEMNHWEIHEESTSPTRFHHQQIEPELGHDSQLPQHEINIIGSPRDFSFHKPGVLLISIVISQNYSSLSADEGLSGTDGPSEPPKRHRRRHL
ncbi:hypothetical protein RD792_010334 [Penstemon davidsonii]|uniref:MLO-like protein 6 n=1 Tax=Penstemon davidsonii TaxID=160366 RepID=A0ABR0D1K0_9LAMI|nr:hypothetical protein RD792_010334 [Penstemon davidsonii]